MMKCLHPVSEFVFFRAALNTLGFQTWLDKMMPNLVCFKNTNNPFPLHVFCSKDICAGRRTIQRHGNERWVTYKKQIKMKYQMKDTHKNGDNVSQASLTS